MVTPRDIIKVINFFFVQKWNNREYKYHITISELSTCVLNCILKMFPFFISQITFVTDSNTTSKYLGLTFSIDILLQW